MELHGIGGGDIFSYPCYKNVSVCLQVKLAELTGRAV
jgi:hypothetical protein